MGFKGDNLEVTHEEASVKGKNGGWWKMESIRWDKNEG